MALLYTVWVKKKSHLNCFIFFQIQLSTQHFYTYFERVFHSGSFGTIFVWSVFTLGWSEGIVCENVKIDLRQITVYLMFEQNVLNRGIDLVFADLQIALTKPSKTNFNRTYVSKHTQTVTHSHKNTFTHTHARTNCFKQG